MITYKTRIQKVTSQFKAADYIATCPKNLEGLLLQELLALGVQNAKETVAGVTFSGSLEVAYRVCLWSRLANRVLLQLKKIPAKDADELYAGVRTINWLEHFEPNNTFMVDFAGASQSLNNTYFGAQKVKDAVVDQVREKTGTRMNVDKLTPHFRINVYLYNDIATVCIDLSGESLHRRGYRSSAGKAPLKENLAAVILLRSNWLEFAKNGKPLLDPMCGSGTILIEAAMMATDFAPGLLRKSFGFNRWRHHQQDVWRKLMDEAIERRKQGKEKFTAEIRGYDIDHQVIKTAQINIERAGLGDCISVIVKPLEKFTPPTHYGKQVGLIVTNPPYGERLGEAEELVGLYKELGTVLRERFADWEIALLTGNPDLGKNMGIRARKQYNFFNGAIPCKLLLFTLAEQWFVKANENAKNISL